MKHLLVLILIAPTFLHAQRSFLSLGVEAALPEKTLRYFSTTGAGASIRYEHPLTNHLALTGTTGFISFGRKHYSPGPQFPYDLNFQCSMTFLQTGAKYYLFSNSKNSKGFYAFGEIGLHVFDLNVKINKTADSPSQETDFSYSPGAGYRIKNLELSYRQQFIKGRGTSFNANFTGFRIAYLFKKR